MCKSYIGKSGRVSYIFTRPDTKHKKLLSINYTYFTMWRANVIHIQPVQPVPANKTFAIDIVQLKLNESFNTGLTLVFI